MAKSKVKKKNAGFVIEGVLNYDNENEDGINTSNVEVEDLGIYPFDKIFKQFQGKTVKITIDEPDEEIFEVPEDKE